MINYNVGDFLLYGRYIGVILGLPTAHKRDKLYIVRWFLDDANSYVNEKEIYLYRNNFIARMQT